VPDLVAVARLLPAEIAGRHADDQQSLVAVPVEQELQRGILRRAAAKRRGIDDKDRARRVVQQPDIVARQRLERKRIRCDARPAGIIGRNDRSATGIAAEAAEAKQIVCG
jgi:hypothetical protein